MADDIDNAAARIEAFNAHALAAVLKRPKAPPSNGICAACSDAIEPERLTANPRAQHCKYCADEAEELARRAKRRGW